MRSEFEDDFPKRFYQIAFVFALALLLLLSLWPKRTAYQQSGEVPSGLQPKEGDNFKLANEPRVYRLENGKKRPYLSSVSYFADSSNPAYGTPYEQGGILICDSGVLEAIPFGEPMPLTKAEIAQKKDWRRFFHTDKLGHFIVYFLFSYLFLLAFFQAKGANLQYLLFFLLLFAIGWGMELLQDGFTASRSFEWEDLLMNSVGIIASLIIHYNKFFSIFMVD